MGQSSLSVMASPAGDSLQSLVGYGAPHGRDWLAARANATPEAEALLFDERVWSYVRLNADVDDLCRRLVAAEVAPGEHVAALLPNTPAYAMLIHALARLGAVMVPLNTRLTPDELAWQLDQADCATVVCAPETESAARAAADRRRILLMPDPVSPITARPDYSPGGAVRAPAFTAVAEQDFPHRHPDRLQSIVFTSGTTGFPKGAMLTFGNHFWSAVGSAFCLGVSPDDRWLTCLPLYHVGGLAILFRSCLYGTAVVLHRGFDGEAVWKSLAEQRITLASLVPTMLHRLLRDGGDRVWPASLRHVLLGGSAAAPELLDHAARQDVPVAPTYGLTEASSQVATMPPYAARRKPGSVGRSLLFTSVHISGDEGRDAPPNGPGEILVAGPTVMRGYYRRPEETKSALQDGFLHTGDVGYLDDAGDLWVLDRRSDLIVSGGENVYPAEVERVLRQHPAVETACVVGAPDPEWGSRIVATVIVNQAFNGLPEAAMAAELMEFCRGRLAGYKRPREIVIVNDLPQTSSGKVQRRLVAERLAAEKTK